MERPEFRALYAPPPPHIPNQEAMVRYVRQRCGAFEKYLYQYIATQYLSKRSLRRSLLLFHGLGTGKTCSAITLAEAFLTTHRAGDDPLVWIVASPALQASFMNEVYNIHRKQEDWSAWTATCTGQSYRAFFPNAARLDPAVFARQVRHFITSRYRFWTYEAFASHLKQMAETRAEPIQNKVIIVDEAHNVRGDDNTLGALMKDALRRGTNNRLVLLSATPMFNEAADIIGLFELLLANEHRDTRALERMAKAKTGLFRNATQRNAAGFQRIEEIAREYVSYVRGANPFTFAVRLSPSQSGIEVLRGDGSPEHKWIADVRDGLVGTPLGDLQHAWWSARKPKYASVVAAIEDKDGKIKAAQSSLMQGGNVIYPVPGTDGVPGRPGFFQIFKSVQSASDTSLRVEYLTGTVANCLQPGKALRAIGSKLDRIVQLALSAKGIVMIYSEFVWGGVVPVAIALEHAGFQRFGENNMLAGSAARAKMRGAPRSYAIISGTSDVMGRKSFAEILEAINSPSNRHGDTVKVVLLTQVASEGLTLKNVREVHIMDPWYHFNHLEQVVGRALRTCSHEALPLTERNVTVYLHCAVAPAGDGMTPDEHAYAIATRKQKQIGMVERTLRDAAFDCALHYNVNYTPPSVFGFKLDIETSQGAKIPWQFGDDPSHRPQCKLKLPAGADRDLEPRELVHVEAILPTVLARMRSVLVGAVEAGNSRVAVRDLVDSVNVAPSLAKAAVYHITEIPDFIAGVMLRLHGSHIVLQKTTSRPSGALLDIDAAAAQEAAPGARPADAAVAPAAPAAGPAAPAAPKACAYADILRLLPDDAVSAKFALYSMLTRKCFFQFASDVVSGAEAAATPEARRAVQLFNEEGVWVWGASKTTPVGFVNVFAPRADFELWMWNGADGRVDRASIKQTEALRDKRAFADVPQSVTALKDTVGFFGLKRDRATADDDAILVFQVLMPNSLQGEQRGALCETKSSDDLKAVMTSLNAGFFAQQDKAALKQYDRRRVLCARIAEELAAHRQMMYPPYYKVARR